MKKEIMVTAHELLKQLYIRDRDIRDILALGLLYTDEAIDLLMEESAVSEQGRAMPSGEEIVYYAITAEGQRQYERGGFKPRVVLHPLVMMLIMLGAMFLVLCVAVGLLFLLLKARAGESLFE